MSITQKFTEEDIDSCWEHYKSYLIDILNLDYNLDEARSDLFSLIGSEFDKRNKLIKNQSNMKNKEYIDSITYRVDRYFDDYFEATIKKGLTLKEAGDLANQMIKKVPRAYINFIVKEEK